jgi:hypothetical protein
MKNWQCPFCDQYCSHAQYFPIEGETGIADETSFLLLLHGKFIHCPNPKCRKVTITLALYSAMRDEKTFEIEPIGSIKQAWRLIPASKAKVFPDYIPVGIRNDYTEACAIKDLSPKASATMARRALQGMIRDFWKVSKPRLIDEIDAIKDQVDPDTWRAIDGLRKIGNVGAHMEKDVNTIIDVEPAEAEQLIWLVETLLRDWYIAKFERTQRLKELEAIAASKKKP